MGIAEKIERLFYLEHDQYVLMIPVLLGTGIGIFFSGAINIDLKWCGFAAVILLIASFLIGNKRPIQKYFLLASFMVFAGYGAASLRVFLLDVPILQNNVRPVKVSAIVENVHLYEDGKIRLTLKDPDIFGVGPLKYVNVRINKFDEMPYPGDRIEVRAGLLPLPEPSMPGDYDYARQVWFSGIGAVGYSVSSLIITERNENLQSYFSQFRQKMADRIRAAVPGDKGALAAALITGIRGGMPQTLVEAMRNAGLAHLLAISGLHMGLLCGVVFFAVRFILSLSTMLVLNYPIKKWSAIIALCAGLGYLFISGASIPTVRAFIMVSIVLIGVLLDRRAISLRLVAIAATVILLKNPEALVGVSFQMSFAAVVALVIVFERFGNEFLGKFRSENGIWPKVSYFIIGSLFTSLVAELAIAPFALFHFNKVVLFGLLANLIAMPIMGSWVMPWIVATLVLMPFELEQIALIPMSWGLEVIMTVAFWVSELPGATLEIPAIDLRALVFLIMGALWVGIWKLRWRYLGIPMMVAGVYFAVSYEKPDILIDNAGKTIALRGDDNSLSLSRLNGSRIVRERWMQRFAVNELSRWEYESFAPRNAKGRELSCDNFSCLYRPSHSPGMLISLVQNELALTEDCQTADVIISTVPVEIGCGAKLVLDRWDFFNNGGYAVWLPGEQQGVIRYQSVKESRGNFPWVR